MNNCTPRDFVRGLRIVLSDWARNKMIDVKRGNPGALFAPWMWIVSTIIFVVTYPALPSDNIPVFGHVFLTAVFSGAAAAILALLTVAFGVALIQLARGAQKICNIGKVAGEDHQENQQ